jgi:acyl-CoA thioesterase
MLEKTSDATADHAIHPFDRATQVTAADGRWRGATSDGYFAFVGPFGGVTAATMLRAVMVQPDRIGDPLSVTVNFCAPVTGGDFDLDVRLIKATRSTQHWMVELTQNGDIAVFMIAMFAARRPSWSHQSATMPEAPPFDQVEPLRGRIVAPWTEQYQFRFVDGHPRFDSPRDAPASPFSKMWLSDATPRPIDFLSLLSMSDSFFARIFHALGTIVPIGTVTMTTTFHADAADLAAENTTAVLGVADANISHKSFGDQIGELWAPSGRLLATTSQVVYFKA